MLLSFAPMDPINDVFHGSARVGERLSDRTVAAHDRHRFFRWNDLDDRHAVAGFGHAEAIHRGRSKSVPRAEALGFAADRYLRHPDGGLQGGRVLLQCLFSDQVDFVRSSHCHRVGVLPQCLCEPGSAGSSAQRAGNAKLAAAISMLLWTSIACCGRGIGYIEPPLDKIHAQNPVIHHSALVASRGPYSLKGRDHQDVATTN